MAEILIPIGHDIGPVYQGPTDVGPESYDIRFGDGSFSLSSDEYLVWLSAHGDPASGSFDAPTRDSVIKAAEAEQAIDAADCLSALIEAGALAPINADSAMAVRSFAQNHRALPLQRGLGNNPDTPGLFQIQTESTVPVIVDAGTYFIWMYGNQFPSLWEGCTELAEQFKDSDAGDDAPPAEELLTRFLSALPALLAGNCVYFDRKA
ncbi:MAG: hypothetical protein HOQ05_05610 [Corynebacteriales bacterium]|nr:hypothetical protein [Mycobacteriales bacterium]